MSFLGLGKKKTIGFTESVQIISMMLVQEFVFESIIRGINNNNIPQSMGQKEAEEVADRFIEEYGYVDILREIDLSEDMPTPLKKKSTYAITKLVAHQLREDRVFAKTLDLVSNIVWPSLEKVSDIHGEGLSKVFNDFKDIKDAQ